MNPFIVTGFILILARIAGCIFPIIPGLILGYISLILLSISHQWELFPISFLVVMGMIVVTVTALDLLVPKWRKKKYGASKPGVLISVAGMLAGLWLYPPWGIVM